MARLGRRGAWPRRRSSSGLDLRLRKGLVAVSAVEIVLTAVALVDLRRRPRELVRGPKALWALTCVIQPVGPVAYLVGGRRSASDDGDVPAAPPTSTATPDVSADG